MPFQSSPRPVARRAERREASRRAALPLAVLALLLIAGCQVAASPPEVSITTTRTRGATPTLAAANAPPSPSSTPQASTRTPTRRPSTATPAPTATRTPATAAPTMPAPTVATTARPVAATPAPGQRTALATPAGRAAAIPTFSRATLLPAPARTTTPAGLLPSGGEQLSGEVLSFAASARVLQMRAGGTTQEVSLAPGASIHRANGSPASAADVRAGQQVRVAVSRGADGSIVASDLTIVGGP